MGAFANSRFQVVISWAESVRACTRSLMISIGIIREFPLRVFLMNNRILWLVIPWPRVSISRAKLLRRRNSVVRALTNGCFHIIISGSKFIRAGDRSIMVAVTVVRELPLWGLHTNESAIGLVMGWAWILVVWADIT